MCFGSYGGAKKFVYLSPPASTSDFLPHFSFALNFLAQNEGLLEWGLFCCFLAWPEVRCSRKEPHK